MPNPPEFPDRPPRRAPASSKAEAPAEVASGTDAGVLERRTMLGTLLVAGSALWAGIIGVPALLAALTPALKPRRGPAWRELGRLEDFPIGRVEPATFRVDRGDWARGLEEKSVYVWRRSAEEAIVYSRNCTDLSCPVTFDPGSECFFCPCHGGIFAKDGTPMAGPPPRPLYRYATRIDRGMLELDANSLPPMT